MNNAPNYLKIPDAVKYTGLSAYFLRRGVKAGTVPHVMSGRVIYIDVPALLDSLREKEEIA